MKTAWVFPGQGSQEVCMGVDLKDLPAAKAKLEQAEQILGLSILELCQSDKQKLSRTLYTQPCLYAIESILADLMRSRGHEPDLVAGHSLGEYVALYTAGVFDFVTGLKLVWERAKLMDSAAGGKMVALIGFSRSDLEAAINKQTLKKKNPDVVLANDNSAVQVVISGTPAAVDTVLGEVKVKRAVPLKVSGAFHSPLMAPVATEFQKLLESISFADARVPVLSNVEPEPATAADVLKQRLMDQITGSVRWREICLQLPQSGIKRVVEIGPGKVLTGLIKRTCAELLLENVSGLADLPS